MENYDDYFSQAKLFTSIHARPSAQQKVLMKSQEESVESVKEPAVKMDTGN